MPANGDQFLFLLRILYNFVFKMDICANYCQQSNLTACEEPSMKCDRISSGGLRLMHSLTQLHPKTIELRCQPRELAFRLLRPYLVR